MAEFGDLSSSVHGFLFTVTNKLPNKSLPDIKKIKIIKKRKEKKKGRRKKKENSIELQKPNIEVEVYSKIKSVT